MHHQLKASRSVAHLLFRKNYANHHLAKHNALPITIHAPYYAPHISSKVAVDFILETTSTESWSAQTANIPLVSSASGKLVWADNYRSLLKASLVDVLLEPLRLDTPIQGIAQSTLGSYAVVHPISKNLEPAFRTALREKEATGLPNAPSNPPQTLPESSEEVPERRPDGLEIRYRGHVGEVSKCRRPFSILGPYEQRP